jgi:hypothetical protein
MTSALPHGYPACLMRGRTHQIPAHCRIEFASRANAGEDGEQVKVATSATGFARDRALASLKWLGVQRVQKVSVTQ